MAKKIPGFPGYEITKEGVVYSTKGGDRTKVATREDDDGYLRVNLSKAGEKNGFATKRVHNLVAQVFLEGGSGEVLHKDGNKKNNSASNLKYGSKSENAKDREKHKRQDDLSWYLRVDATWEIGKWETTPEGYLKATAVVAREGPLEYDDPSSPTGTRTEYVTEEALRSAAPSMLHKPVTFEHPPDGEVNADNHVLYAKGTVFESRYDDDLKAHVAGILVTDRQTIDAIVKGNIREVSPGYRAQIVRNNRSDEPYEFKQVARYCNHLAITRAGRGGDQASIRLDSEGNAILSDREDGMTDEEKAKMDALEKENADMKKKLDAMEAKVDAFEKMAEKKEDAKEDEEDEEKREDSFVKLFNERQDALELAKRVNVEVDKNWTNPQLKKAIVSKALGGDVRLDSDGALQGAYEAVVKMTPAENTPEHMRTTWQRNDAEVRTDADDLFSFYDKPEFRSATILSNQETE